MLSLLIGDAQAKREPCAGEKRKKISKSRAQSDCALRGQEVTSTQMCTSSLEGSANSNKGDLGQRQLIVKYALSATFQKLRFEWLSSAAATTTITFKERLTKREARPEQEDS